MKSGRQATTRATAADVARAAGVDRSTVSRILNRSFDQHRYAPETIQAVQRAARELNYQPSMAAKALRTGRSMLVGMLVGDIANAFFSQLAAEVESRLRADGYRLMIGTTSEDPAIQRQHLQDMLHRGVDGLIVTPMGGSGLKQVTQAGKPIVLVDRPLPRMRLPFVGLDNHEAGRLLGEHLRELGYRRIAVVLPELQGDPTMQWRLDGLAEGLGKGRRIVFRHTLPLRSDAQHRHTLAERLAASRDKIQAIVALTNDCTVSVLEALRDVNLSVPNDVGLAGVDDFRAAELLDPPLTVVAQPIDEIASAAAGRLLAAMTGSTPTDDSLLPPRLIVRQSLRSLNN